ncbi:MAG: TlpA disulfide reductase family protein [Candidatus Omnitrophota bacterium]
MMTIFSKIVFLFMVVSTLTIGACSNVDSRNLSALSRADDFTLESLQGGNITLSDVMKEKNVVLVFFATWCPSCVREVPSINKFYTANKDNIAVIGIDIRQSKAQVKAFVKEKGVLYPVVLDVDGQVADSYEVRGIPTIVAIARNGAILYQGHSLSEMTQGIEK